MAAIGSVGAVYIVTRTLGTYLGARLGGRLAAAPVIEGLELAILKDFTPDAEVELQPGVSYRIVRKVFPGESLLHGPERCAVDFYGFLFPGRLQFLIEVLARNI